MSLKGHLSAMIVGSMTWIIGCGGGGGGSNTVGGTVVSSPHITSLRAVPTTVVSTGSTILSAEFENGTGVWDHGVGGCFSFEPKLVFPSSTTTYTLTVTNTSNISVTSSITVNVVPKGAFTNTGSLPGPQTNHTDTLLPNGLVLITGWGYAPYSNALLYNPSTGGFRDTGLMSKDRNKHTATLLPNGKVLIVGGEDPGGQSLATAELYNPTTGTFTLTGSLPSAKKDHTATLLQSGKVLIAGGYGNGTVALASAQLYDPSTGLFTTTGSMGAGRVDHTATLLQNGKVLVVGGSAGILGYNELYNPATGSFASTGNAIVPRTFHTATLLNSGKVLITGGYGVTGTGTSTYAGSLSLTELYDPLLGTFTSGVGMKSSRQWHTATLLSDGNVLLVGGVYMNVLGGSSGTLNTGELYCSSLNEFVWTEPMSAPRCDHTATLLPNGKVLVVGGMIYGTGGMLTFSELFGYVPAL